MPFFSDRKSAFGIGIELNAECQRLIQVQQERQGRSLDRLATELYSKDTHFVLELIQVASVFFSPKDDTGSLFVNCFFPIYACEFRLKFSFSL